MDTAGQRAEARAGVALVAAALLLASTIPQAWALPAAPVTGQLTFTGQAPNGQGTSTITVSYSLPTQAEVGSNLTVQVRLVVDSLTGITSYLEDYNVSVSLSLSTGRVVSGGAGVTAVESASNGTLLLRAGQAWGPVDVSIPLTGASTGLAEGQEALGNATLTVGAGVWLGEPVGSALAVGSEAHIGYALVSAGSPSAGEPNLVGLGTLAAGIALLLAAVAWRAPRRSRAGPESSDQRGRPPGAV
ncbi:MAG: hypothetical protein JRM86_02390 [Nitrososphaerota archaeon]|nr:hypothetical protein [Nitrososphaerota archaeon]